MHQTGKDDLLTLWAFHQAAAGHTARTVTQRLDFIHTLTEKAGRDEPAQLTAADLIRYLSRDLSPRTKRTYFMHARAWFRWLHAEGYQETDLSARLPVPKAPKVSPRPFSTPVLLRAIQTAGPRTAAYLTLAAFGGLRACEIAAVRGDMVTIDSVTIRGKGGTLAMVPTHPRVWSLASRHDPAGFWFKGRDHGHVDAHGVSGTVTRHLRRQGLPGSLHRARHWYGTNVLRAAGGNLRVAQECLRHSSPATTAGYTMVEDDERTAAVLGLPDFLAVA